MSALVIGIGNPDRGDDAVGLRVVEALRETSPEGVELQTVRGDMLALLDRWDGAETVVLVDAMQAGDAPGTLRRIDALDGDGVAALGSCVSSHAFDLSGAIALAESLGRVPARLVVFGIEAAQLETGAPLSDAVERAVPAAVAAVLEECACTKRR